MKSILLSTFVAFGATLMVGAQNLPTGKLNASSLLVRAASNVDLDWQVQFPVTDVEDIVEIDDETNTVRSLTDLKVEVRLLGAGYGNALGQFGYLESFAKFKDESAWLPFFVGFGNYVKPNDILKKRQVKAGNEMNFSFRGAVSAIESTPINRRTFNPWRIMGQSGGGIIILKNGDLAPNFAPEQTNQTAAKSFLVPYLSSDQRYIKIGPKDVIILVDLNKYYPSQGADFQDYVILMTFDEKTTVL